MMPTRKRKFNYKIKKESRVGDEERCEVRKIKKDCVDKKTDVPILER